MPARVPAGILFVCDMTSPKSYSSIRDWMRELTVENDHRPGGICDPVRCTAARFPRVCSLFR